MVFRILTATAGLTMLSFAAVAQVPPPIPLAPEMPSSLGLAQCPANCASAFQKCIDGRVARPPSGALSLQTNPPRQIDISKAPVPSDEGAVEIDAMKSHAVAAESCKPVSAACNARCG